MRILRRQRRSRKTQNSASFLEPVSSENLAKHSAKRAPTAAPTEEFCGTLMGPPANARKSKIQTAVSRDAEWSARVAPNDAARNSQKSDQSDDQSPASSNQHQATDHGQRTRQHCRPSVNHNPKRTNDLRNVSPKTRFATAGCQATNCSPRQQPRRSDAASFVHSVPRWPTMMLGHLGHLGHLGRHGA